MSFKEKIKENERLKNLVHYLLIPKGGAKPRTWVKLFVNPFVHKRKSGSKISWRVRLDVLPFNNFYLGENSVIEDFSTINNGVGDVIIGSRTLIGIGNVLIGPVTIGNNVILAQNIVISGLNHGYQDIETPIVDQRVSKSKIVVEDDCWVAANSVITAGVTIGKHCVVAAGSVVTKNVPPFSVVAGNPAKIIKQYNHLTRIWEKPKPI